MNAFETGLLRYFSRADLKRIQNVQIGIAGAGGLGSNCAMLLVRSGFTRLTIVDFDKITASNLNRQFYFLGQNGRMKVEALAENLLKINPNLHLNTAQCKIEDKNIARIFAGCDILVEAFDEPWDKALLVEVFGNSDKMIVAASGIAGYGASDRIQTRRIRGNFYVVGDMTTGVDGAAPFAPAVMIAAAKQADLVLAHVLGKDDRTMGNFKIPDWRKKKPEPWEQAMENFNTTGIYALTAENLSQGRSNIEIATALIEAGVKVLQYREKDKNLGVMLCECQEIRALTRQAGVTFIINDHVDLALLVGADGVHLGQDDLPAQQVRNLIGQDMILGLSTHDPQQLSEAERCGCLDYVGVGPVFETQTKRNVCDPVGLDYVRYAAEHGKLPFVAIGGIKEHNIAEVAAAGARTIAVVSAIVGAADISQKVADLREVIGKAQPNGIN